jgi:uncharacterized protein with HEPN domain
MRRDPRTYLWDALTAADRLNRFQSGKTYRDYLGDELLRSAVERQFEIVGEALNQFAKLEPTITDDIADLGRLVAFRNILIHGYATVDDTIVWQMLTAKLPALQSNL